MRGTLPRSSVEQNSDQIAETVRRTLKLEGEALTDFADRLPEDIEEVVRLLVETIGRVVVTGMGKSGHVARKIAATLASTGTPSFYLHPGEASHGDLGMVTTGDVVIAISNSGETTELSDLLSHCLLLESPIVGISREADSTLMRAATFRLQLPAAEEACLGRIRRTGAAPRLFLVPEEIGWPSHPISHRRPDGPLPRSRKGRGRDCRLPPMRTDTVPPASGLRNKTASCDE